MFKLPLLTICTALLVSNWTSLYAASPPDAAVSPSPDTLLKTMSNRLASAKQYRFTVSRTIPKKVADEFHQQTKANVEVVVARPDKLSAKVTSKGATVREMIFDGRNFTVTDGANHFYSQAPLRGSLDDAAAQLVKVYGFRPPLAAFILSDPYRDLKSRAETVSYLGQDTVRQGGRAVQCHRIGLQVENAAVELWLGTEDSLPRRLRIAGSNSGGGDPLVDINFLTWDFNSQLDASAFHYRPLASFQKIPMVTVAEARTAETTKSKP